MDEEQVHVELLWTYEQMRAASDTLTRASKGMQDEKQRQHTLRALASLELAVREIAALYAEGDAERSACNLPLEDHESQ